MKKVLIVGAGIIEKPNAAGITLKSIFSEVDSKLLMGVDWGQMAEPQNFSRIPIRYLSFSKFSFAQFLNRDLFKRISRKMKKDEVSQPSETCHKKEAKLWRAAIKWIRQWVALLPASSRIKISKDDMAAIRAFAPQVVYTVGETVTALRVAYTISKELDIPIVIHFMDNWKHSIEWASNPFLKQYQRRLSRYCDLCYSRSTECIAIGERMAEAYEKETGIKHSVVMNSIDTQSFYCPPREKDGITRFVYAGGLHLGRDKALRAIGEAIERVFSEMGKQAEFLIYTPEDNIVLHKEVFDGLKYTKLCSAVPHDKIIEVYKRSDILVHVESDALGNNEFFKYSVSTKISEYLATGLPFLFWGPTDIYLFDFLKENKLAYTASNIDEVDCVLRQLSSERKNDLCDKARVYAASHFDIDVARTRFIQTIQNVRLPQ